MSNKAMLLLSTFVRDICSLPEGIKFYEVDGQIIFPIKFMEGDLPSDFIIYLIKEGDFNTGKEFYKYGISLKELFSKPVVEFMDYLRHSKASTYDPNGSSLGIGDNT